MAQYPPKKRSPPFSTFLPLPEPADSATRALCRAYWTLLKEFAPHLKGDGFLPPDQINHNNLNTIEDLQQAYAAAAGQRVRAG